MSTILNSARASDAGAHTPEAISFFGEPRSPHYYEDQGTDLEAKLSLCYMAQSWPQSIEGHWANVLHAIRTGIHPDALDRAEEAIIPHAEDDLARQLLSLLRIKNDAARGRRADA
jgi:hypothetical protein